MYITKIPWIVEEVVGNTTTCAILSRAIPQQSYEIIQKFFQIPGTP